MCKQKTIKYIYNCHCSNTTVCQITDITFRYIEFKWESRVKENSLCNSFNLLRRTTLLDGPFAEKASPTTNGLLIDWIKCVRSHVGLSSRLQQVTGFNDQITILDSSEKMLLSEIRRFFFFLRHKGGLNLTFHLRLTVQSRYRRKKSTIMHKYS